MDSFKRPLIIVLIIAAILCGALPAAVQAQLLGASKNRKPAAELTKEDVDNAINRATQYLASQQRSDGSWTSDIAVWNRFEIGVSSLATLALLNAGMKPTDPPVAKGLGYLRSLKDPEPTQVYEISLMIMALAAAKDKSDIRIIRSLANKLEASQIKAGDFSGGWGYDLDRLGGGDNSNSQYAVLGLREAAAAGVNVDRQVWVRARDHWIRSQSGDGGWNYKTSGAGSSTGSMTAAGIATLVITESMLRDADDVNPDGTPRCCGGEPPNPALDRGVAWMEKHFAVGSNPFDGRWILYYLYGMERAGRLSGRRFFGQHDWYREGASYLVGNQTLRDGSWMDHRRLSENCSIVSTSFAILFLSKGLAPVLINKLNYEDNTTRDGRQQGNAAAKIPNWNQHRNDIRNLTEHISNLDKWPRLLTWQQVNLPAVMKYGGVEDLLQAPILYLSGVDAPNFSDEEVVLLKRYILEGGFIFAVNNCNGRGFDQGIRDLVRRMYPDGDVSLKRLGPQHAVFRSEYILDAEGTELWGIDVGCRTPLIYAPDDYACLWDKVVLIQPPDRPVDFNTRIAKALKVGVNVVAYVTGREPPDKLKQYELTTGDVAGAQDQIERGFLQIAKLRHPGDWNAAPSALRHLLIALNKTTGTVASTKQRDLAATDNSLFQYPILYMHGRTGFQFGSQERRQIVEYLSRGNVLFADACCGAPQFDASFRELVAQLYPDKSFQRIPADHEIFTTQIGYDIRRVKRRVPRGDDADSAIDASVEEGEPYLEGIEVDGRYVVIYSKYDLSCALERQASVACVGYSHEDAVRIAINIVRYAMLQSISYQGKVERVQ